MPSEYSATGMGEIEALLDEVSANYRAALVERDALVEALQSLTGAARTGHWALVNTALIPIDTLLAQYKDEGS